MVKNLFKYMLTLLILLMSAFCINAQKRNSSKMNNFLSPDFAYPETVITNAEEMLSKSLDDKNYQSALLASIQITISKNSISQGNVTECISLLDSLQTSMPAPYSNLAALLEARLYGDIYHDNAWTVSDRILPLDYYPENPMDWSKDLFAQKILSLVAKACDNTPLLKDTGLDMMGKVIRIPDKNYLNIFPSLYHFVANQSIEMLTPFINDTSGTIPFQVTGNKTVSDKCNDFVDGLYASLIDFYSGEDESLAKVYTMLEWKKREGTCSYAYLQDLYSQYSDQKASVLILSTQYDLLDDKLIELFDDQLDKKRSEEKRKIWYQEAKKTVKNFPNNFFVAKLKSQISLLEQKGGSISSKDRYLSNKPINFKVTSTNCNEMWLFMYRMPSNYKRNSSRFKKLKSLGELVLTKKLTFSGDTYFTSEQEMVIPNPGFGNYVVLLASSSSINGIKDDYYDTVDFVVSDLALLTNIVDKDYNDNKDNKDNKLIVVSAYNQQPISGAKVTYAIPENQYRRIPAENITHTTDENGEVPTYSGGVETIVTYGKDRLSEYLYFNSPYKNTQESFGCKIFTDLAIYHPGDEVEYSAVVWKVEDKSLGIAAGEKVTVEMINRNWEVVDSLDGTTDSLGRLSGTFKIPKEGVLGRYKLQVRHKTVGLMSETHFQVSDYVSPTFFVELSRNDSEYTVGDTIRIKGKVCTYSGMPMAGVEVKFDVKYQNYFWWWRSAGSDNAKYGGSVTSDAEGNFVVELNTENLKDTPYALGCYTLQASAVSLSGETQQSEPVRFSLGQAYNLNPRFGDKIEITGETVGLSVDVTNSMGADVTGKKIDYTIEKSTGGEIIASGTFVSPELVLPSSSLPSGQYKVTLTLNGSEQEKSKVVKEVVIFRKDDSRPPYATPLWVPETTVYTAAGETSVDIQVGSAYNDSWILCEVSNDEKILKRTWIKCDNQILSIPVAAPENNQRVWVTLSGMKDFKGEKKVIEIIPAETLQKLEITSSSFRDKIVPGSEEIWVFNVKKEGIVQDGVAALAVMSNKALNALVPFSWSMSPSSSLSWDIPVSLSFRTSVRNSYGNWTFSRIYNGNIKGLDFPNWNTYGYGLYGNYISRKLFRSEMYAMNSMEVCDGELPEPTEAKVQMAANYSGNIVEDSYEEAAAPVAAEAAPEQKEPVREIECPLAFFYPGLVSDMEGNIEVKFKVPDFNTTWAFQLIAYDEKMKTGKCTLEAIAAKKVMVQSNVPRFLRTGDRIVLKSILMNNTESEMPVAGKIQLFNPLTSEIIREMEFTAETIGPKGSRLVQMEYAVPDDAMMVGFRAFAYGDGHSDGEQTIISILPSSSPVIASSPFYLGIKEDRLSHQLPSFPKEAKVTLTYCDNPIWECLTALPAIYKPESASVIAKSNALFANQVSAGIMQKYPQARKALEYWLTDEADSMLVSKLSKDEDLKLFSLNNTIWVRNAESQTLRMHELSSLLDSQALENAIHDISSELTRLQKHDGGWSWCEDMPLSSLFITANVLADFASLRQTGFWPEGVFANKMIDGAVNFCDDSFVKDYKRYKEFSVYSMVQYLYYRSYLDVEEGSREFCNLKEKVLDRVEKDWRSFDIYLTSTSALLLMREGRANAAQDLIESLRQRAVKSKTQGMYYDNLSSGWNGMGRLMTTVRTLLAFYANNPSDPAVDALRQWILLQKQDQDWGWHTAMSEVIGALLSTGSDWTKENEEAEVRIDGKVIDIPHRNKYTGEFRVELDGKQVSNKELEILRHGEGPAWGGVIYQYIAPIKEVKAQANEFLKIEKNIWRVDADEDGEKVSRLGAFVPVGQKVRVMLTIECKRDMDYVAIKDERGACLSPIDQISSYTYSDDLWYYKEVRNDNTNLFIEFLPKGNYQIYYDCYVTQEGDFSVGIANAQSLYAPVIVTNSAGIEMQVNE